jgi:hypothetical protein
VKRSLQESILPPVAGAAVNAGLARAVLKRRQPDDAALHRALRVTGNTAFVFFALPLAASAVLPSRVPRLLWRAFLGAHATLIVRCAVRHRGRMPFSSTSIIGGAVGYTTIAALTAASIAPGRPPREPWRRQLQRAGHNILMGMHAFTIGYGYLRKGRNAKVYTPLAVLWLAAVRGMDHSWRGRVGGRACSWVLNEEE